MSDRPEDDTNPESAADPESRGQDAGGEPGTAERSDAPWWHQPHPGAPSFGSQGGSGEGRWPEGGWQEGQWQGGPWQEGQWQAGQWQAGPWQAGQWNWGPSGGGWAHPAQPPATGGRPPRRGLAAVVAAAFTALALLVGVGIGYGVWSGGSTSAPGRSFVPSGGTSRSTSRSTFTATPSTGTPSTGTAGTKVSSATGAPSNIATIRSKVKPELVDINTVLGYATEEAAGTGMVLTPTGKVLTNNHVIEEATKISATDLGNGRTYSATVLGYTRTNDIAVIQLEGASGLKTVHIGNSSSVKVGEAIVGIGNAGGTGGVPSAAGGSVTALDRSITASDEGSMGTTYEHLTGLIESNADIRPGDSGGPLVTTSGVVVGMDTAASESEGYTFQGAATGQGYSIPINEADATARRIIAGKGSPTVHIGGTAFLGVYVEPHKAQTEFSRPGFGFGNTTTFTFGTSSNASPTSSPAQGAYVKEVIPGTAAQRSGIAATDVITSVGGTTITSPTDLTRVLLRYHPGDSVEVGWTTSSGQAGSAKVTFGSGPPE